MAKELCPICRVNYYNYFTGSLVKDGTICGKCWSKFYDIMGKDHPSTDYTKAEVAEILSNPNSPLIPKLKFQKPLDVVIDVDVELVGATNEFTVKKVQLPHSGRSIELRVPNTAKTGQILRITGLGMEDAKGSKGDVLAVMHINGSNVTASSVNYEIGNNRNQTSGNAQTQGGNSKSSGLFSDLRNSAIKRKQDKAIQQAYLNEQEKRKPHIQRIEHRRELNPMEQQTVDTIDIQLSRVVALRQTGKMDLSQYLIEHTRLEEKKKEIIERAVWYEEITIPPEIDPSIPINIDEEAIRKSITSIL